MSLCESYPKGQILAWWLQLGEILRKRFIKTNKEGVLTIWFIGANVTLSSVQSDAIALHHQGPEKEAGTSFPPIIA